MDRDKCCGWDCSPSCIPGVLGVLSRVRRITCHNGDVKATEEALQEQEEGGMEKGVTGGKKEETDEEWCVDVRKV